MRDTSSQRAIFAISDRLSRGGALQSVGSDTTIHSICDPGHKTELQRAVLVWKVSHGSERHMGVGGARMHKASRRIADGHRLANGAHLSAERRQSMPGEIKRDPNNSARR
jgi:hypothetical protein